MKRRQFLKTIPAIAVVPYVAQEILKAAVEDAQAVDPPMTATEVNDLNAVFIQQYDRNLRDMFARDAGIVMSRKLDNQIVAALNA